MAFDPAISPPDPIFLGYIFKRVSPRPKGWGIRDDGTVFAPVVERICSVCDCISPAGGTDPMTP